MMNFLSVLLDFWLENGPKQVKWGIQAEIMACTAFFLWKEQLKFCGAAKNGGSFACSIVSFDSN